MMTAQDADVRRMVFNEFFSWRRKWSRIGDYKLLTARMAATVRGNPI
jgi:hypothetical protein